MGGGGSLHSASRNRLSAVIPLAPWNVQGSNAFNNIRVPTISTGRSGNDRALLSTYGVSWMKRYLDKDNRYTRFLCGPNHESNGSISEYRDTSCS